MGTHKKIDEFLRLKRPLFSTLQIIPKELEITPIT